MRFVALIHGTALPGALELEEQSISLVFVFVERWHLGHSEDHHANDEGQQGKKEDAKEALLDLATGNTFADIENSSAGLLRFVVAFLLFSGLGSFALILPLLASLPRFDLFHLLWFDLFLLLSLFLRFLLLLLI